MERIRPGPGAQQRCHVIPSPNEMENLDGALAATYDYTLSVDSAFHCAEAELRKNFRFSADAGKKCILKKLECENPEEYRIAVSPAEIMIECASEVAVQHAVETLKQLQIGDFIPEVKIRDYPAVKMRGFHTNLASFHQTHADDVLNFIGKFAKFKLNTYIIEYNERFPFTGHPSICGPNAFTSADIQDFERLAAEKHIDLIPLVQCIGHNEHIGALKKYAGLFEPAEPGEAPVQLCPCNPDAFRLFTELAEEIMQAHPRSKYLHIGGDETGSLGSCPQCAAVVRDKGKARLYVDYINKVIDWVVAHGRTPIAWDDMFSHFAEAADNIDKRVVIMYWDYWTTSSTSPIFVARTAGRGLVADKTYAENNFTGLEEPERTVVREFAVPVDVMELLASSPTREFARYLGEDLPKRFTGFPYLDYYHDLGFQVICAPSSLGNSLDDIYGLPNYMRFRGNIREFAEKCKKSGALGMVTTAWFNFPVEMIDLGIIDTAQNLWIDREPPNLHPRYYALRRKNKNISN